MNLLNVAWWNIPTTAWTNSTDHTYTDTQYTGRMAGLGATESNACTDNRWKVSEPYS